MSERTRRILSLISDKPTPADSQRKHLNVLNSTETELKPSTQTSKNVNIVSDWTINIDGSTQLNFSSKNMIKEKAKNDTDLYKCYQNENTANFISPFSSIVVPPKEASGQLPASTDIPICLGTFDDSLINKYCKEKDLTSTLKPYISDALSEQDNGDTESSVDFISSIPLVVVPPKEALPHFPVSKDISIYPETSDATLVNKYCEEEDLTWTLKPGTIDALWEQSKSDTIRDENSVNSVPSIPLVAVPPKEVPAHLTVSVDTPTFLETFDDSQVNKYCEENDLNLTLEPKPIDKLQNKSDIISVYFEKPQHFTKSKISDTELDKNETSEKEEEVETAKRNHYKDKKTFCFFCEKDVTHFSRHIFTWHEKEIEVQRIQSFRCKSKERRTALGILAKKGNYLKNRTSSTLRPVKRIERVFPSSVVDFLPCSYCLGFYKKRSLYRHTKQCSNRKEIVGIKRQAAQSEGQTALLIGNFLKFDKLLTKELFPHMRADDINLLAKGDKLICNYAYSYMKGRRSKGNLDLVRQNVRRLAKLLQYSKEENDNIKELMDLLRPQFFQLIIKGVNKIGGYDVEADIYNSPTVAMNFGTLLKKCCDLAYVHFLQSSDTEKQREELNIFKVLIESQWANEVSAQAASNLNTKKWNKEELLPLTSDLKKLKDYLEKVAQEMFENLMLNEEDFAAYNTLKEVLYTQIILMNRRRPPEVSQIKVQTYKSVNLDTQETEFDTCLTETEKILLRTCSRIVIRGKRGTPRPILLSPKMREHFDFLVKIREYFVRDNDFIFHTGGKSFIDGSQILYKYAHKCGAENPKSISATRLRKHLATVTQLLQFSTNDLEQLSRFMGHTLRTHCEFYRLSDNMYQTAKISKLLLLATDGGLEKFKGMKLDEIHVDLDLIEDKCDLEDKCIFDNDKEAKEEIASVYNSSLILPKTDKKIISKQSWSFEEKQLISEYFSEHIKTKKAPRQNEVQNFMKQYTGIFDNRKWTAVKAVVYNIYTGKLLIR